MIAVLFSVSSKSRRIKRGRNVPPKLSRDHFVNSLVHGPSVCHCQRLLTRFSVTNALRVTGGSIARAACSRRLIISRENKIAAVTPAAAGRETKGATRNSLTTSPPAEHDPPLRRSFLESDVTAEGYINLQDWFRPQFPTLSKRSTSRGIFQRDSVSRSGWKFPIRRSCRFNEGRSNYPETILGGSSFCPLPQTAGVPRRHTATAIVQIIIAGTSRFRNNVVELISRCAGRVERDVRPRAAKYSAGCVRYLFSLIRSQIGILNFTVYARRRAVPKPSAASIFRAGDRRHRILVKSRSIRNPRRTSRDAKVESRPISNPPPPPPAITLRSIKRETWSSDKS